MASNVKQYVDLILTQNSTEYIYKPKWSNKKTVYCTGCESKLIYDVKLSPQKCPYCGGTNLSESEGTSSIAPHGVIPFLISKEKAREILAEYINKNGELLPAEYKKNSENATIEPIFVPYWFFTATVNASYQGKVQNQLENYDRAWADTNQWREERMYNDQPSSLVFDSGFDTVYRLASMNQYTKASGRHSIRCFTPCLGTRHRLSGVVDSIFPFYNSIIGALNNDSNYLEREYTDDILGNVPVESYDVSANEAWHDAQPKMADDVANSILAEAGGDKASFNLEMNCSDITFYTFLVPVWIASFQSNGTLYTYAINGQTGQISGKKPDTSTKLTLIIVGVVLVVIIFCVCCCLGPFLKMLLQPLINKIMNLIMIM